VNLVGGGARRATGGGGRKVYKETNNGRNTGGGGNLWREIPCVKWVSGGWDRGYKKLYNSKYGHAKSTAKNQSPVTITLKNRRPGWCFKKRAPLLALTRGVRKSNRGTMSTKKERRNALILAR